MVLVLMEEGFDDGLARAKSWLHRGQEVER
jgi:hypothetical protein